MGGRNGVLFAGMPVGRAVVGRRKETVLFDFAPDVFVADEVADVVGGGHVAEAAGGDELGAVVGEHGVGVAAVDFVELRLSHNRP